MPALDAARLVVSIDLEAPLVHQAVAPIAAVLQQYEVPACWAVTSPGQDGHAILQRATPGSDLALLAEEHWYLGGRSRFARELKHRMAEVVAAGLEIHTLVAPESRRLCYPDLLVRHRLCVARGQKTGRDSLRAHSIRYGIWQAAPTLDLRDVAARPWASWTFRWKAARQLRVAMASRDVVHVLLRVAQAVPTAGQLRALGNVCRQAVLLSGQGRLKIETLRATVEAFNMDQRHGAGRSVLRAA